MPKIIDNVRERAIAEARRLMLEESYENLTIRRVAAGLGVAVGTLYNYFPSKDFLIAGVMLEDWQTIMSRLAKDVDAGNAEVAPIDRVHRVFDGIKEFSDRYSKVWAQYSGQSVRSEENMYHIQLIQQIMHLMDGVVSERAAEADPFLLEFIAENVLRFASDGRTEFSQIEGALTKLLAD